MFCYLTALVAALALAAGAGAADKKLTIRWHGQSLFEIITSEGTRVVMDPHAIDAFGRQSVKADLVVCSHLHSDHTRLDSIDSTSKPKVLYGVKEDKSSTKKYTWTNFDEKFKDVHLYSIGTYHDDEQGLKRGLNSVTVIEADGFRVVHLGDLGHKLSNDQLKSIGKDVDVLMVPIGGIYTLNGGEAKEVVAQIKPRFAIIPMHYGIKKVYEDLLTADEFLEDQSNVVKDKDEWTLEVGAKPPEKPQIVLLNWIGSK
jgi:L-ascorbate metabolism protein UlaG (beta-lactamase superfamily)